MIDRPYDPTARALELKRRILSIMSEAEIEEYVALVAAKVPPNAEQPPAAGQKAR